MTSVLLIIHIILAIAIIGLVLLQRSSGGGLGIGETGGAGGFATPRSAANILTKLTTWCAIAFFGTSLGLAIIAGHGGNSSVLKELQQSNTPPVPVSEAPVSGDAVAPAATPDVPADAPATTTTTTPEAPVTP